MERTILSQLPDSVFRRITITDDDIRRGVFVWEEEGREFRYHGILYDLVRIEQNTSDLVTLIAMQDEAEEEILDRFAGLVERSLSHDGSPEDTEEGLTITSTWTYLAPDLLEHSQHPVPITYPHAAPSCSIARSIDVTTPPPEHSLPI